jgi:hypothetical protein
MAMRGGWRSFAHRQDPSVLAHDVLAMKGDRERVTEMRTGKRGKRGTIKGGGLP